MKAPVAPPSAVRDLKAVRRKSFVVRRLRVGLAGASPLPRSDSDAASQRQVHGIVWAQERLGWRLIALRRWRARFFADSS